MNLYIFNSRTFLSISVAVVFCLICTVLLRNSGITLSHFHNQWVKNYAVAEGYMYSNAVPEVVVIGSSMAARLDRKALGNDVYNMSFNSVGFATGLDVLLRGSKTPGYVLLEANIIENQPNEEMISRLYYPVLWRVKAVVSFLQFRYQPANYLVSVVNQRFGRSSAEKQSDTVSATVLDKEIQRHLAYNNQIDPNLETIDLSDLRAKLSELESRGATIVLFTMPVDKRIDASYRYTERAKLINKYLSEWIHIRLPQIELDKYKTTDGIHLTPGAAKQFSTDFADILLKMDLHNSNAELKR